VFRLLLKVQQMYVSSAILLMCGGFAASPAPSGTLVRQWHKAGVADAVAVDDEGTITLHAVSPLTAGGVTPELDILPSCDAVLVEADVSAARAGAVTFAVHDTKTGEAIGYWCNPLPIGATLPVSAVLPLSGESPGTARLFAGTHQHASSAKIARLRWTPLRRNVNYRSIVWGALVDDAHRAAQTFRAKSRMLAAVVVRIRDLNPDVRPAANAALRVRLYAWKDNPATTRAQEPLAETIVPRHQIPTADGSSELDLSVPLSARTQPGATYWVEFTAAGPCPGKQGLLLFGGEDGYAGGSRYENENPLTHSDLYLETFDVAEKP